jgi:erythromycin esterase-like protein
LAGLDDQLGSAGAFYSLGDMPPELAASLEGERRTECSDALRRRINYDFESEYTPAYRSKIVQCVADMSTAISKDSTADRTTRDERLQMVANVERALARDFSDQASLIAGRDQSMYLNFRWLAGRLPPRSKIIVWGATAHMAKDANALPEYSNAPNLGFLVHRDYGRRAFVLAFSAASGAHYWSRKEPSRQIEKAAPNSLEAAALAPSANHATYLGPAALMRLGKREGGALSFHKPLSVSWSDVIDGLVVFPEERPPQRLDSALSYP